MNDLPPGWTLATLGDLVARDGVFSDGDWVETKDQDLNGSVRLTQLADVGEGAFRDRSNRFLRADQAAALNCTFLEPGDVLIARMPDPLGRACVFPGLQQPAVTAVDVCIVRPGSGSVDPRWLMWTINAPQFRARVLELQSGTTRRRISRKNLGTIKLPVPPLNEQQRIAAAIEEHLSRLEAADGLIGHVRQRLSLLADLTLEAAFKGGSPVPIGDLGRVVTGSTPSTGHKDYWGDGLPFATPSDLVPGRAISTTQRQITPAGAKRARPVPSRSVLVTCIGATIGKTSLATMQTATNQQINAIVADEDKVTPEFLVASLSSPSGRRLLVQASSSTTMPILNKSKLMALSIPLPSPVEQRRVVAKIEKEFSAVDALRSALERADGRSASLRRAILERAIRGELVPQDPADEPASALLERIRAGRAVAPKLSRRSRVSA